MSQQLLEGLAVKIRINSSLMVLGDCLEIELLFNNLISNAVAAAMRKDSPQVSICAQACGDKVVVQIENSGAYVSEQALAQLTIPFVSEKGSGHGLGIPISMSLAEANGGHFSYKRRADGGLIAEVTLRSASSS